MAGQLNAALQKQEDKVIQLVYTLMWKWLKKLQNVANNCQWLGKETVVISELNIHFIATINI
jgi:hypothetical protein